MLIKKTSCKAGERGFSLMELLLVMTLAPIIFFAVYSNFTSGVRLWQRMQVGTPEEDQVIFRLKAQRDFQSAQRYAAAPFTGEHDSVSFMAGIEAGDDLGGKRAMGEIRYFYEDSANAIARQVKDFSQLYKDATVQPTLVARNVRSLEITYLVKDQTGRDYSWKDDFRPEKPGELPLAVRLTYTVQGASQQAEQTFFVPAGGSLN